MSLDNIYIDSQENHSLSSLHVEQLNKIHQDLKLVKPIIFYLQTDEEVRLLNKKVLDHDYYTDVITFDYEDDDDLDENEVVISWERVIDNAQKFDQDKNREMLRVFIHAMLHLAGFNDSTVSEKKEMSSQEEHYLTLHCST